jgi:hypothetical protein
VASITAKLQAAGVSAEYFEIDSDFGQSASGLDAAGAETQSLHGDAAEPQLAVTVGGCGGPLASAWGPRSDIDAGRTFEKDARRVEGRSKLRAAFK